MDHQQVLLLRDALVEISEHLAQINRNLETLIREERIRLREVDDGK